jgi:hypothetical protein
MSRAVQEGQGTGADGGADLSSSIVAEAYGANLEFLGTCLSCTTAQAGPNGSGAQGRDLRLAGEPLSEGQVPQNGYSSDAFLVLPQNPLLRLAIADWEGSTTASRNSSHAHARGALLELAPADGGAFSMTVGESTSDATYNGHTSRGSSESNGLRAGLMGGRFALVLLHSDSSSDSAGRVCIASVNGEETVPSSVARGERGITVPGATKVAVLQSDSAGALIGSASDGRSQRMVAIGSTRVGSPAADPQPLR